MMKHIGLLLRGFLMGSADVVPGVSGGTMALITGIYSRLIDAIKSVDGVAISYLFKLNLKGFFHRIDWQFLLPLVTGIILAILFFTRIIPLPVLIFTHPEPIYGLFFGLILGSIVLLMMDIRPINLRKIFSLFLGTLIGFWVVNLVPTSTPDELWFILLSGMVAITAMILPGISGSFILLILGKYSYIFGQFAALGGPQTWDALIILGTFGVGIILGLAAFSRVLSWLLHRYNVVTLCVLIGFLIGTLSVIWPWQNRDYETLTESVFVEDDDPRLKTIVTDEMEPHVPEYYIAGDLESSPKEVIRVQKKLIHSEPILPGKEQDLFLPMISLISGLMLVLGIGRIAQKNT